MLRRDERFAQAIVFLLVFVSLSPNYAKININSTIVIRLLVHRFLFETFCSFYSSIEEFSFFKSEPVDHHVRLSLPRFLFLYFLIFFFFFFTKFRFVSCLVFFSNHAYHSPPDLIVPVEHAADFRHFHPFFPPPSRTFVSIFFFAFSLFFFFSFFSFLSHLSFSISTSRYTTFESRELIHITNEESVSANLSCDRRRNVAISTLFALLVGLKFPVHGSFEVLFFFLSLG